VESSEIPIASITVDLELYPRRSYVWEKSYRYAQNMKVGIKFPPILVADFEGKYVLVDGLHRMKAHERLGLTTIEAIVIPYKNRKDIFYDAVKLNNVHGFGCTFYDNIQNFSKLRKLGVSDNEISLLVGSPIDRFERYLERLTTVDGKEVNIKKIVLEALKKNVITESDVKNIVRKGGQDVYVSNTVNHVFRQAISVLEQNLVSWDDSETVALTVNLFELLKVKLGMEDSA